jgi:hypothetical protein
MRALVCENATCSAYVDHRTGNLRFDQWHSLYFLDLSLTFFHNSNVLLENLILQILVVLFKLICEVLKFLNFFVCKS